MATDDQTPDDQPSDDDRDYPDIQKAGDLLVPGTPRFSYPSDLAQNVYYRLRLKLTGKDLAFPLSPGYEDYFAGLDEDCYGGDDGVEIARVACNAGIERAEFNRLAAEYVRVVRRNLAAGWVWGPHGNIQITLGRAQLGSCSDWQLDIYRALCALPNVNCYQICQVRTAWHKAVVVYPKSAFWWRTSGTVFDPWFLGGPFAYTVPQWFFWCGLSWRTVCCK